MTSVEPLYAAPEGEMQGFEHLRGKRVLYILPQPFFVVRGSSFRALATIQALEQLGMQVDVLSYPLGIRPAAGTVSYFPPGDYAAGEDMPIGPSWRKCLFDIPLFARAFAMTRRVRYDFLHGVEEGGLMAGWLGKRLGIPYLFDMHSLMSAQLNDSRFVPLRLARGAFARLERKCLGGAAAVITVSDVISEKMVQWGLQAPVLTLHDLPLPLASATPDARSKILAELGMQDQRVLLYTGNFGHYQGVELLVRSFAELINLQRSAGSQPCALVLAGGAAADVPEMERLKQLAKDLGVGEHVIFAGLRPWEEMATFMDLADVLISPRILGENTPLKIYSYMAAGKPIVATRIATHTAVLNDANSYLCEPDSSAMALAMRAALSTEAEALRLRSNRCGAAQSDVREHFGEEAFRAKLGDCYLAMLSGGGDSGVQPTAQTKRVRNSKIFSLFSAGIAGSSALDCVGVFETACLIECARIAFFQL